MKNSTAILTLLHAVALTSCGSALGPVEAERRAPPSAPAPAPSIAAVAEPPAVGLSLAPAMLAAPAPASSGAKPMGTYLLKPARVFDGAAAHDGWVTLVRNNRIEAVGPEGQVWAPCGVS